MEDTQRLAKTEYPHSILSILGTSAVKMSVSFFILRTINKTNIRTLTIAMILFLLALGVTTLSIEIFKCVPAAAIWTYDLIPTAKCLSVQTYRIVGVVTDCINLIVNLILATLPIPLYYDRHASSHLKMALIAIVACAYVACGAAVMKTIQRGYSFIVSDGCRDTEYTLWNNIELQIGILAASLPTLSPLFKTIVPTLGNLFISSTNSMRPTSRLGTQHHYHTSHYGTHDSSIHMDPTSPRRQSRLTLHRYHLSSSTTYHHDPENPPQTTARCPTSHYKVEVSASRLSGSPNGSDREAILAASRSGFPAIMRTTDVYVHMGEDGNEEEEDIASPNTDTRSVGVSWKIPS
ncbi:hypothetical protein FQN53_009389 [Emmonsiellopsis sp. PD_33]|nr:hypothetical protein FQN53_009389 [Emmonsiellopsis sp. PD_33]